MGAGFDWMNGFQEATTLRQRSCYAKVTTAAHSAQALLRVLRLGLQRVDL